MLDGVKGQITATQTGHSECQSGKKPALSIQRKSKAMVFPVVMYGCESWAIKKAER